MTSCRYVCYNTFLSTIAQLVERMTVNHDVAGSRPAGGVCFNSSKRAEPLSHVKSAGRWSDMDSNHHKHKVHLALLVKWSRHHLFTAVTGVRFPYGVW